MTVDDVQQIQDSRSMGMIPDRHARLIFAPPTTGHFFSSKAFSDDGAS
jgi:hypothetical protein